MSQEPTSASVPPSPPVAVPAPADTAARGPALTVYFDGACPLCSREIAWYRSCRGADTVAWVNVAETPRMPPDLDRETALARFHVRLADGTLVSGAAGFAALWRRLPAFRLLGWIVSFRPVTALAERAYLLFLPLRARMLARLRGPVTGGSRTDGDLSEGSGDTGDDCGCVPPLARGAGETMSRRRSRLPSGRAARGQTPEALS
ncbi:thiol-disulfide oxidoreductase DCC family protein [Pannonibacter tanglangensis]|uniref:thiol-disulfide oxidoreductase DCC family protein n=1 Tax=Pannonibacter tanglangensis TaxID=2750084 RepID=UPI0032994BFD